MKRRQEMIFWARCRMQQVVPDIQPVTKTVVVVCDKGPIICQWESGEQFMAVYILLSIQLADKMNNE